MLVKNAQISSESFLQLKHTLSRPGRTKWFTGLLILLAVITGTHLFSVYYGMYLHKTGQSNTISGWVWSIAEDKFSFVGNFIDGLAARPERIDISINFREYMKLVAKREEALARQLLVPAPDDWVPATIRYKDETYRVDIRLKGDLADHWKREDGWSFKVKVKDNKSLFGLSRFAIQNPRTRNYLSEWYFHKMLAYQEILHLRYDFIEVSINGKLQPIYAIEENFEKRLIESNRHREGPIVRLTSGYSWIRKHRGLLPIFLGASLDVYQEKKVRRSGALSAQYAVARDLFELFRQERLSVSQVFHIEKFARLFAIYDLLGHDGPAALDDVKFYYNPVTSLIEPIGYDFNSFHLLTDTARGLLGAGRQVNLGTRVDIDESRYDDVFFSDRNFFEAYVRALEKMSKPEFLDEFFASTDAEHKEKLGILYRSFPWYNFKGKSILYKNQKYIRDYLSPPINPQIYFAEYSSTAGALSLKVRNIHALPIEILRVTYGETAVFVPTGETVIQAAKKTTPIEMLPVELAGPSGLTLSATGADTLKVHYRILGAGREAQASVFPWPYTDQAFLATDLMRQRPNPERFDFLAIDEDSKEIAFKPGEWALTETLVVPSGYTLLAGEGVTVDLSDGANILSFSPLRFIGSEESPVVIHSADSTGQGVVVMNAGRESLLRHVRFENLRNPSESRWELSGAVTFYESPVTISHGKFVGNPTEDSLNIIRSKFRLERTLFIDSFSDAFDGDYVEGTIQDTTFLDTGNDAIDVSGSVVELRDVHIRGVGDKALSAGENSRMTSTRVEIQDAELAVTSKDHSEIKIDGLVLSRTKVGLTVFQKKPEYGPATIVAKNVEMEAVQVPYLLEAGSELTVDGRSVEPTREDVKGILYGVEFGKSSR